MSQQSAAPRAAWKSSSPVLSVQSGRAALVRRGISHRPSGGATVKAIDAITPLALTLSAFPRAVLLGATSVVLLEGRIAPAARAQSGTAQEAREAFRAAFRGFANRGSPASSRSWLVRSNSLRGR